MKNKNYITLGCVVVALLVFGGSRMYLNNVSSELTKVNSQIEAMKTSETNNQTSSDDDSATTKIEPKDFVAEATEKGKLVADVEKRYSQTVLSMEGKDTVDDEIAQIEQYTEELNQYFADDVSTTDKTNWYSGKDVDYEWEFQPVYEFKNSSINVTWVCKQKDTNAILSIVSARYDANAGTFNKFSKVITDNGYKYIPSTGDDGTNSTGGTADNEDFANAILKMAEENKVEPGRDVTDEEVKQYDDVQSARDQLKQQMEKDGGDK